MRSKNGGAGEAVVSDGWPCPSRLRVAFASPDQMSPLWKPVHGHSRPGQETPSKGPVMRSKAREYRIVKVPYGTRYFSYVVVSEDLQDREVWAVIDRFYTLREARQYVYDITHRQAVMQ